MKINRTSAPFYVQFELTERCNNKCFFCYNPLGRVAGKELNTKEIINTLTMLKEAGVFRVNFNGGEPLMRTDFIEIMEYAHSLGFMLHMNTNSTLVTPTIAKETAKYMKSICTSILSSDETKHDKMTGRTGAYKDVLRGIDTWREYGVDVEVNVCTSTENVDDIYNIGKLIADHDCYALCATRYILNSPNNKHLLLDRKKTERLIDLLFRVKEEIAKIVDVSLPGPVPFCEVSEEYQEKLRQLNVPCQYGYGLARISPVGIITPCAISDDKMGDLRLNNFSEIWHSDSWEKFVDMCHIPSACTVCEQFNHCRGGCVVYDEALVSSDMTPMTKKWRK